jgi:hypothetical protein
MHALQCPQCNPRHHLPEMRLQEPAPKEQGTESVTGFFNIRSLFYDI